MYIPTSDSDSHTTTSSTESPHATSAPESMPLRLPSTLPAPQPSFPFNVAQIECRFRLAQAEDSLSELRRLLRIKMSLWDYKAKQIGSSQRAGTRAFKLISRFTDKISRCTERYRVARSALLTLDPTREWQTRLRELEDTDIRPPGRRDGESEGSREVPWIWMVTRRCGQEQASSQEQSGPPSDEELNANDCEHMG